MRYILGHNQRGKRAPGWKGGRKKDQNGYWWVWAPDHPNCVKSGYIREHRLIWEQANGRLLRKDEDVHHIDGDRSNNRPENLVALAKQDHVSLHSTSEQTCERKSAFQTKRYKDIEERKKTSIAIRDWWARRKSPS